MDDAIWAKVVERAAVALAAEEQRKWSRAVDRWPHYRKHARTMLSALGVRELIEAAEEIPGHSVSLDEWTARFDRLRAALAKTKDEEIS